MMEAATAQELLTYNTWANNRALVSVAALDSEQFTRNLGGSYPSLQATLTHMLWAEWLWLERWNGGSPKELFAPEEFPSVPSLRSRWSPIQASQDAFGKSLTALQLQRVLRYTNRKGEQWEYALWRMIHHLCNHSTYHRGQVTNMLRLLGVEPVATDFLVWWDEGR
jgi:uncharacterized damage-inducible protein DinB